MIRVAQYQGESWTSKAIKFMSRGKYSHTAIILGSDYIVEAWKGSNSVRTISSPSEGHASGTVVDIYELELNSEQEEKFREFVLAQVGKPYDNLGILGFLWRRDIHRSESWFCSELFAEACKASGKELYNDTESSQISPSMVARSIALKLVGSIITK